MRELKHYDRNEYINIGCRRNIASKPTTEATAAIAQKAEKAEPGCPATPASTVEADPAVVTPATGSASTTASGNDTAAETPEVGTAVNTTSSRPSSSVPDFSIEPGFILRRFFLILLVIIIIMILIAS